MDEQDLPIDIHTNKLLDWLVSRRHCGRNWSENILTIRQKINNAIQDMPAVDEITKLLSGTFINYFHCLRIVEILKETESETRNIFGRYSSQRMKDWQEILTLYQKDNIYLAEAAQMLIRNVNYEIPFLKKQVAKLQQIQQECIKKANDCAKNSTDLKDRYRSSCRQLGIKGDRIEQEILEQVKDLKTTLNTIVTLSKNIVPARDYYVAFTRYILGENSERQKSQDALGVLSYCIENGNTTVYEWKYGKKPTSVEEVKLDAPSSVTVPSADDTIDFGDDAAIDFGDNQIDFGDNGEDDNNFEIVTKESIECLEDSSSGIAKGEEALAILECANVRNTFINDLYELEAFLEQRLLELQIENDLLSLNQFQSAPPILQMQSVDSVSEMLTKLSKILRVVNDAKMQQMVLIRESPSYVNRLAETLRQKLTLSEKMLQQQEIAEKKRLQALEEEQKLEPQIDLIIRRMKELQKEIESDISKRYKNRPVNIMGGVNTL